MPNPLLCFDGQTLVDCKFMKNLKIVIAQDGYATTMEIEIFRLHHIAKHKYEEVTRVQRETCMAGGACLTERVLRLKT